MEDRKAQLMVAAFDNLKKLAQKNIATLRDEPGNRNACMLAYNLLQEIKNIQDIFEGIGDSVDKESVQKEISELEEQVERENSFLRQVT